MTVSAVLGVHEGLAGAARISSISRRIADNAAMQLGALALLGAAAALAGGVRLDLRIPGHAILRAVFPMALGLALAPSCRGGTVMGTSALATALAMKGCGLGSWGAGALTSLTLTGPFLDLSHAPQFPRLE